ncbi:MAG: hypothetical protein HKN11_16385 [Rhizobiales bacterium]|nr:hypothetical protein [Hyphomicrobiales bacterium]
MRPIDENFTEVSKLSANIINTKRYTFGRRVKWSWGNGTVEVIVAISGELDELNRLKDLIGLAACIHIYMSHRRTLAGLGITPTEQRNPL